MKKAPRQRGPDGNLCSESTAGWRPSSEARPCPLNSEHLSKLRESALSAEHVATLGWSTLPNGRLLIPYLGPDGSPQLCTDGTPFTRERLSQAELIADPSAGKYRSPAKQGCRLYHSAQAIAAGRYPERLENKQIPLRITEGELKTEALAVHDPKRLTIGLGGVNSWMDRRAGQSKDEPAVPLPELVEIPMLGREVRICFDSDVHKPQVRAAVRALSQWLLDQGATVLIERLPNEADGQKNGADDLIHRHGGDAFQWIAKHAHPAFITKGRGQSAQTIFNLPIEPDRPHHKAVAAWTILKDSLAIWPGHGIHQWDGKCWRLQSGKTTDLLDSRIHGWMDQQGWQERGGAVMNAVRNELAARITTDPDCWDQPTLMAFENGTLNTTTGAFTPLHRREDHLSFALPYDFDPAATCPQWLVFLHQSLGSDAELFGLVRAAIRWTLQPKDRSQPFPIETCFDVSGRKGTGKSTFSEVLQALVGGNHGAGIIKSSSFATPNALQSLIGKRAAIDPDCSGRITDPGAFNNVVSNEPLLVKRLYQDLHAERLGVVIWRFFNDRPSAAGGGLEGMGRRIVTIPFDHQPTHKDVELKAKLMGEVAGVFTWAWSLGAAAMFDVLKSAGSIRAVKDASVTAAIDNQPIIRFVIETFPYGSPVETAARDLYSRFRDWCQAEGHQPASATTFGRELAKLPGLVRVKGREANHWRIGAMSKVDWADHFGIATLHKPSTPQTNCSAKDLGFLGRQPSTPSTNPPHPEPAAGEGISADRGGCGGFASKETLQENETGESERINENGFSPPNPPYPPPNPESPAPESDLSRGGFVEGCGGLRGNSPPPRQPAYPFTVTGRVKAAQADGRLTVEQIARWAAERKLELGKAEIERTLKRQQGGPPMNHPAPAPPRPGHVSPRR